MHTKSHQLITPFSAPCNSSSCALLKAGVCWQIFKKLFVFSSRLYTQGEIRFPTPFQLSVAAKQQRFQRQRNLKFPDGGIK